MSHKTEQNIRTSQEGNETFDNGHDIAVRTGSRYKYMNISVKTFDM